MSDATAAVQQFPKGKVAPRHVFVTGKVTRVRRHDKFFYTTIICPAADVYSKPQFLEIRSKSRFAEVDELTEVNAILGGYEGRSYQVVDEHTGERRSLIPVNLFLDLDEA